MNQQSNALEILLLAEQQEKSDEQAAREFFANLTLEQKKSVLRAMFTGVDPSYAAAWLEVRS